MGEGEAVGFKKSKGKVKVCVDGKIKVKNEKLVDFTLACNGKNCVNLNFASQSQSF